VTPPDFVPNQPAGVAAVASEGRQPVARQFILPPRLSPFRSVSQAQVDPHDFDMSPLTLTDHTVPPQASFGTATAATARFLVQTALPHPQQIPTDPGISIGVVLPAHRHLAQAAPPFQAAAAAHLHPQQEPMARGVFPNCASLQGAPQQPINTQSIHPSFAPVKRVAGNNHMSPRCSGHSNTLPPSVIPNHGPFQEAGSSAQFQGLFANNANHPHFYQGINGNTMKQQQQSWQPREQVPHKQQATIEQQQKLRATASFPTAPSPLQIPYPSHGNNQSILFHSPLRSRHIHLHHNLPQEDAPHQSSQSSHGIRHVTLTFGRRYEYQALDDGSCLVRYTDAGITSGWVRRDVPPQEATVPVARQGMNALPSRYL